MLDSLSFPHFDLWRQKYWPKEAVRFVPDYCVVARLKLNDKDYWIDGAVLELASENALFREASHFILNRQNEQIVLEIEGSEHPGQIVKTEEHGYRIVFFEPLSDAFVGDLRERWRIEA